MTRPTFIHDKARLESYLLRRADVNFYHIGDLDDFFWPYTTWLAQENAGEIEALALIYAGTDLPVLLAIENDNAAELRSLLQNARAIFPPNFYSHLSPGLDEILAADHTLDHHGEYRKMALRHAERLDGFDTEDVETLGPGNLEELQALYEIAYPGNWFDPRMLETRQYTSIRDEAGGLMAVAGIHVYSPAYKTAALGNITVQPERRGQGLGTLVTAGLCKQLLQTVDFIGLNVRADNAAAIRAYEKVGFEIVATYHEWMVNSL